MQTRLPRPPNKTFFAGMPAGGSSVWITSVILRSGADVRTSTNLAQEGATDARNADPLARVDCSISSMSAHDSESTGGQCVGDVAAASKVAT